MYVTYHTDDVVYLNRDERSYSYIKGVMHSEPDREEADLVGRIELIVIDIANLVIEHGHTPKSLYWAMDEEADLFEHHLLLSQSDAGAISSDIEEYPPLIGKLFVLNRLYVEGEYRGRGFAAMMINDAINRFVGEQDVMSLFAIPQDSGMDQKRLVKLYQEHGFSRTPLADNHLVYLGWSR